MTRTRMLAAGAALALTLGLGAGIAAAQSDPTSPAPPMPAGHMHDGDMGAMHGQMRAEMPDEMQAQCDSRPAQGGTMPGGGMMNGGFDGRMTAAT